MTSHNSFLADIQIPFIDFVIQSEQQSNWVVQCDFDGTISLSDVTDSLLNRFGLPGWEELEEDWESGKIGSRECMQGQVALLDMSREQLEQHLTTIEIDPQFPEFVAEVSRLGWPIHIVSDGLDWSIRSILARYNLAHLPIFANRLVQQGERQWRLETPWFNPTCAKASANCKCQLLKSEHQQKQQVLYIGDSNSDFCVSGKADMVLAKSRLITYCQKQKIPHQRIDNFQDAIDLLHTVKNQHVKGELVSGSLSY